MTTGLEQELAARAIPADRVRDALRAVATRTGMHPLAVDLGLSVPAMIQIVKGLVQDPEVYAQHPRWSRVILDRLATSRARRQL